MKRCPNCNRTYTDEALNFCLEDGTPLVAEGSGARYPAPGSSGPPPPPAQALPQANRAPHFQPQWAPTPMAQPRRSNAVWWVLGGLAVIVVLSIGIIVVIIALASMSAHPGNNRLVNVNTSRNSNLRLGNANSTNSSRANTNSTANLPASFADDFSESKWDTGTSPFGNLSYANDEYHMRSKEHNFIVVYAPSDDYNTENATVRVTTRNIDGISPKAGYGLAIHGLRTKDNNAEDYTFAIDSGEEPRYRIVLHKGGEETVLVEWTPAGNIRKGTSPNQLEVRVKGPVMTFYINGQLAQSIADSANLKRGRAGLYTSDVHEVAFDDLTITR